MNIFKRKRDDTDNSTDTEDLVFKPFHETYRMIAMCLSLSLLYPNPEVEKTRFKLLFLLIAISTPLVLALLYDFVKSVLVCDLDTVTRHITVGVPSAVVWIKVVLLTLKRDKTKYIIDEFNGDHAKYNSMSQDYKEIAQQGRQSGTTFEALWIKIVPVIGIIFPVGAAVKMFFSFMYDEIPKKFMVHDLKMPFTNDAEDRFNSPLFEIVFLTMIFIIWYYVINFIGVDGLFGLAINHTRVKINVYCKRLEIAFQQDDIGIIKSEIGEVIKEQLSTIKYVNTLQEIFNIWLGFIFTGTAVQICTCIYQLLESKTSADYITLALISGGSIIHIYIPCLNASKLKYESVYTATRFYTCGWHHVTDCDVRKSLMFMIARAQLPLEITAFNMFSYDMEMFVGLLKTSYSLFTLIRP